MRFIAKIEVKTGKGQLDPESETVRKALVDLSFQVSYVRAYKGYEIHLEANSKKEAENIAGAMCSRLLVNPTKDDYTLAVEQVGSTTAKS
ncbi:MAG: phosphoribosylformylglycinamidine synthase subunit PurS [Nitrososphaerales archaeon]